MSPSPLSFQDIPKIFPETVRTSDLGWISQSLLAMMAEVHSRLTIHWLRKRTSQMAMPIAQQRRCACAPSMFRFCFGVQECSDDEEELNDMCYKKLDPQVGVCTHFLARSRNPKGSCFTSLDARAADVSCVTSTPAGFCRVVLHYCLASQMCISIITVHAGTGAVRVASLVTAVRCAILTNGEMPKRISTDLRCKFWP